MSYYYCAQFRIGRTKIVAPHAHTMCLQRAIRSFSEGFFFFNHLVNYQSAEVLQLPLLLKNPDQRCIERQLLGRHVE